MRQFFLVIFLYIGANTLVTAQVEESFADGDFTQSPAWTGQNSFFTVNAARQLQSDGPAVTGTSIYLSTPNALAVGTQWEYYVQLSLATSAGNYAEVHLTSDVPDITGPSRGYFVRMGGTEDEISLYRKDGTTASEIIDGPDQTIAGTDNRFWVRITRSLQHAWTLEVDVTGTRQNYQVQGTATDNRYLTTAHTSVHFRYSQANAQRFYFDDYTIKDVAALGVTQIEALDARTLQLTFSKPIAAADAQRLSNYRLNGTARPTSVQWQETNAQVVRLQFDQDFKAGANTLEIERVTDLNRNEVLGLSHTFSYSPRAAPGEVRITEIYADINPLQDLPAAEFIEIYNRSDKAINLKGWRYSDATSNSGTFPAYLLGPGEYLIVCAAADTATYKTFGRVVGLSSFPSLNDGGDDVELFDDSGQLIDFVRYTSAWYREATKREGGWSLELMNVNSLCTGASQWKGSESPRGGTPGQPNSMQIQDVEAPVLQHVYTLAPDKVVLRFSEPLDSVQTLQLSNYSLTPGIAIAAVRSFGTSLAEVELSLGSSLQENERYTVTVASLSDCAGNKSAAPQMMSVVLPSEPRQGDVVINEILFNPRPNGVDFVEIVNRSANYLDLKNWKLSSRQAGAVAGARPLSTQSLLLAPGQYLAFSTAPDVLQADYPAAPPEQLRTMPSLPSFPDAAGTVVLLLPNDSVMDEVSYNSGQHFKLLRDAEGVSLERISLAGPSVEANFHSAATTLKATPGYRNSQARELGSASSKKMTLSSKVFTPDGDGVDDVLLFQFHLSQPGFVASINIFNANGNLVRKVTGNTLLGTDSFLQWDGLSDRQTKAAIGYYIVLVELFNLQGQREVLKETVVVGGRF